MPDGGIKIGHIRLVETLGEGGMGTVWAGFDEKLRRDVAVKAIRSDRIDLETRARFLAEARILSQLEHPNICRLYDYVEGEESDYLVLERIRGRTLREAIDEGLDRAEKLRIAEQIARTLVVAHARGVVHRDLKPGNVMLADDGVSAPPAVKVLDFGLARSLDAPEPEVLTGRRLPRATPASTDGTLTRLGSIVLRSEAGRVTGTPANMSPEQARGERATPASDMYSFSLLLQELFNGRPVYPPDLPAGQVLIKAAEGDTLPVEGVDRDVRTLIERLKALAPEERPTASEAAARLAWIRRRPRRRRRWLTAAVVVAFLIGIGVKYALDLRRERQEAVAARDQAQEARREAEQVTQFMVELFQSADPAQALGREVTAREILDQGAERITRELTDQPLVRARIMDTLGTVYRSLGEYDRATGLQEQAVDVYRGELGEESEELAGAFKNLAASKYAMGHDEEAARLLERALEVDERILGPDHPEVANALHNLAVVTPDPGRAEALYRRALEIREQAFGPDHLKVAASLRNLATIVQGRGAPDEAEELFRRALEIQERILEPGHPDLTKLQQNFATLLYRKGELARAGALYREALESRERVLGSEHPETAITAYSLAALLARQGAPEQAEPLYLRALATLEDAVGPDHPFVAVFRTSIGDFYFWQGDLERAEPLLRRVLDSQESLGAELPAVVSAYRILGSIHLARGDAEGARLLFEQALESTRRRLDDDPGTVDRVRLAEALLALGRAWHALGEPERAEKLWREALGVFEPIADRLWDVQHLEPYAEALLHLGRLDEARPIIAKLAAFGARDPELRVLCRAQGLPYD